MPEQLTRRIQSGLETVKKWESKELLAACRSEIPFHEICPEQYYLPDMSVGVGGNCSCKRSGNGNDSGSGSGSDKINPYAKPDDFKYKRNDLLLKRLTVYFQKMMTWVNNPPCELCGCTDTRNAGVRGPIRPDERQGEASRVEIYYCPNCNAKTTTFPRYNNPMKILETKKGRCGEYANLFGAFCRSAGFETRYITDFTDHVWVEVWSHETSRWIMADGCEGTIDEPGMYEKGWGKTLCYNIACTVDSVTDVTRRYTRKFNNLDFQARRRQFTPDGEHQSDMIVAQYNAIARTRTSLSKAMIDELDWRQTLEKQFLDDTVKQESWGSGAYSEGRLSGSLAWKTSRGEAGSVESNDNNDHENNISNNTVSEVYHVDCFHPAPYCNKECSIVVSSPPMEQSSESLFPACITIMGTPCGAGIPQTISIVVIDDKYSSILQSRVFGNWNEASMFLSKLPDGKIVVVYSDLMLETDLEDVKEKVSRLGNFNTSTLSNEANADDKYFFYIGQVNQIPQWSTCQKATIDSSLAVSLDLQTDHTLSEFKLQCHLDSIPQTISSRLPNEYMPLQSQLLATEQEKQAAFMKFIEKEVENVNTTHRYVGFATKKGSPVYIMCKEAFPFTKHNETAQQKLSSWTTYHFVPEPMWYEEEVKTQNETETTVDVPIDESFFASLLGNNLLRNDNQVQSEISTSDALSNSRLVALYFSAHWCGPCRNFTPLLSEMYTHLKSVYPTHGLEVVFVSSDRDESSYQNYFTSMPWLSVPYSGVGQALRRSISERFAIEGIPALVVLDSISGSVVVPKEQSRTEVMKACQGGDVSIEQLVKNNWLQRVPVESKNMMEILKLSCVQDMECDEETEVRLNPYLQRRHDEVVEKKDQVMSQEEQVALIKEYFSELVGEGMSPNEAAAKAINKVACHKTDGTIKENMMANLLPGTLRGKINSEAQEFYNVLPSSADLKVVLSTAKKYVDNVQKQPFSPKFRNFKLSNKFFDKITSSEGGLEYITNQLGFCIYNNGIDFMASIPLSMDIAALKKRIDDLLSS